MIGVCLFLSVASVNASASTDALTAEALEALAERQYRAGLDARADSKKARPLFREAADAYEQLWKRSEIKEGQSPRPLYRNPRLARDMAQAHLLAGDLAQAIRSYHLGLQLAPHDGDLQAGLAYARKKVQYPIAGNLADACRPREQRGLLYVASADALRGIAAFIYLIGILALARAWMSRRVLWPTLSGVLLAAAATLGIWVLWEEQRYADGGRPALVVVAENNVPLRRGNDEAFPLRLNDRLPAGVEMLKLAERAGWLQVQLANGEVGWVEKNRVVAVD